MNKRCVFSIIGSLALFLLLVGCSASQVVPTDTPAVLHPTGQATRIATQTPASVEDDGSALSLDQIVTLESLQLVDDFPLYTMYYQGAYDSAMRMRSVDQPVGVSQPADIEGWGCSLFTAFADRDSALFGRNFDWEFSPAMLLFTDPPAGYASVSMVDIAYLGFDETEVRSLTDLPLGDRVPLLDAPLLPFDGMNELGLTVGMAAVPPGDVPPDPDKESIGSLGVIRQILDHASTADEAVAILESYNIEFSGGPPIHYLIAEPAGRSVLVEFHQGEIKIIPNSSLWQQATNFLVSAAGELAEGLCWRYDLITERLSESSGWLSGDEAMGLLSDVSQGGTQWSIVYEMGSTDINVVMGRAYEKVYRFSLSE